MYINTANPELQTSFPNSSSSPRSVQPHFVPTHGPTRSRSENCVLSSSRDDTRAIPTVLSFRDVLCGRVRAGCRTNFRSTATSIMIMTTLNPDLHMRIQPIPVSGRRGAEDSHLEHAEFLGRCVLLLLLHAVKSPAFSRTACPRPCSRSNLR